MWGVWGDLPAIKVSLLMNDYWLLDTASYGREVAIGDVRVSPGGDFEVTRGIGRLIGTVEVLYNVVVSLLPDKYHTL